MSVATEPVRGSRALPRLFLLALVMATAATAGSSTAGPYLAAGLLVAAGLVMALASKTGRAAKPRLLLVVLHLLIPLQVAVTVYLRPGNLSVILLLLVTMFTAWITATEVARRLCPTTAERALLVGSAVLSVAYLTYALPRLRGQSPFAWVDVATGGRWLNGNALAVVFLIGIAVALAGLSSVRRSPLHLVGGVLCLAALLLTFSRSGYLALVAMLVVLVALRFKAVVAVAALAALLVVVVPSPVRDRIEFTTSSGGFDPSASVRLDLWESALGVIADMPLLGSGIHALSSAVEQHGGPGGFTFAHNSYLSLIAGFGIPIGLLVLGAIAASYLSRVRAVRRSGCNTDLAAVLALTAVAVCSFFGEPLLTPVTIVPLAALLGLRKEEGEAAT